MLILNFGCGNRKQAGEIGVDITPYSCADIRANLCRFPLPFRNGSIDVVRSSHFFEHIRDTVGLMNEIYRILKPGGVLEATVPHVSNIGFFRDPTHERPFTYGTFDHFVRGRRGANYTDIEFEYVEKRLQFSPGLNGMIGKIISRISVRRWEKYYLWRYPAYSIHVKMRSLKPASERFG